MQHAREAGDERVRGADAGQQCEGARGESGWRGDQRLSGAGVLPALADVALAVSVKRTHGAVAEGDILLHDDLKSVARERGAGGEAHGFTEMQRARPPVAGAQRVHDSELG